MRLALGGDSTAGPWHRTGADGEKGPTNLDDALGGVPQPGWKTSRWTAMMKRQGGTRTDLWPPMLRILWL